MGDTCPFAIDLSNEATVHWLGLAAIIALTGVLVLVTAWLNARMRIEELEDELAALTLHADWRVDEHG